MKELLLGLWAAVRLGAEALWDTATAHWNVAPERCRRIFCCIVAVILILFAISVVAHAENAADSSFGLIRTGDGVVFACYLEAGSPAERGYSSDVYTCLVMQLMGEGVYMSRGGVTYCTNSGEFEGQPVYQCGRYEDMRELATGF
jgi:hypothetical protein